MTRCGNVLVAQGQSQQATRVKKSEYYCRFAKSQHPSTNPSTIMNGMKGLVATGPVFHPSQFGVSLRANIQLNIPLHGLNVQRMLSLVVPYSCRVSVPSVVLLYSRGLELSLSSCFSQCGAAIAWLEWKMYRALHINPWQGFPLSIIPGTTKPSNILYSHHIPCTHRRCSGARDCTHTVLLFYAYIYVYPCISSRRS